jgi:PAS domain S-box-containing protein
MYNSNEMGPLRTVILGLLLCFALLPTAAGESAGNKQILLINSYHAGFSWSDEEEQGLVERFREVFPAIDLPVEYLDAKRYPEKSSLVRMKAYLANKYRGKKFDLIVALDDPAVEMLTVSGKELFPGVPVVFAGVSNFNIYAKNGRKKITGVLEKQDIIRTIKTALELQPGIREILAISDNTVSGIDAHNNTKSAVPLFSGRVKISFLPPCTFDEAGKTVARLPSDAIVLLNSYSADSSGKTVSTKESTRLIVSASKVPVYGVHENRFGDGIIGGYLLGGRDHGRRAAAIGLRVLAGENPDDIAVDDTGTARPMFDYQQLDRFKIPVAKLPAGSSVINKPTSVFTTHREFAVGIIAALVILLVIVSLLVIVIIRMRQARAALRSKTDELDRVFRLSPDLLCISGMDGRLIRLNPVWENTLGYRLDELEGQKFFDFVHPDDFSATYDAVAELSSGKDVIDFTNRYRCKDGSYRWIEWRSTPYQGKLIYAAARDITEKKLALEEHEKLKEQLFQSQKMETLGLLAGGVAHDFNNLLTPILGYTELLLLNVPAEDPKYLKMKQIFKAADLARELTGQLLAFSRKQMLDLTPVNIGDIIRSFESMLHRIIRENIRIDIDISPELDLVRADRGQIEQSLLNLAINARDAMPRGGVLTITVENIILDETYTSTHLEVDPGHYVMLSVGDTGLGMDEDTRAHIFEPFFTTKVYGQGTGLGLATVYGIVKQHGGSISVYSEENCGSLFKIFLPRATEEDVLIEDADKEQNHINRGNETVLLVEDNEAVRTLVGRILQNLGYNALVAENVECSIGISRQYKGIIHLLLSDVVMPVMNGRELFMKLSLERPGMKVLYMSGYTNDVIGHHGILNKGVNFIQKPFTLLALSQKLRKALES